jgi:hypothetical protein
LNIEWIIPCRYVEVHDNLGTIIGAGIDTFWVPELPAPIQVILAIRLLAVAEELDPDQQHTVTNRVRGPDGEVMNEATAEFSVGAESPSQEWLKGSFFPWSSSSKRATRARTRSSSSLMTRRQDLNRST